jgi:hypothetical protein
VAHLPPQKRAGALVRLLEHDLEAQGVALITVGLLKHAGAFLPALHQRVPVHPPKQVPMRALFAIYPLTSRLVTL